MCHGCHECHAESLLWKLRGGSQYFYMRQPKEAAQRRWHRSCIWNACSSNQQGNGGVGGGIPDTGNSLNKNPEARKHMVF